jgi:chromosomal replication initiation ATPase DnaA
LRGRIPDTEYVLSWFDSSRKSYRAFIKQGIDHAAAELDGGGLIRSLGGQLEAVHTNTKSKDRVLTDQRILGTGDFVEQLLKQKIEQKSISLTERQQKMDEILRGHCEKAGIALKQLQGGSRAVPIPRIRSDIAHALVEDLGIPYAEIARQLGVSHVAVLKMMKREGSK